jgi:outer membrane protein OmpA-like peptidoglycan-associated protein
MKTTTILNRIFKAALLLVLTSTLSFGQSELMSGNRKKSVKKVYRCKHVGLQKVDVKKFSKKETEQYVSAKKVARKYKVADTTKTELKITETTFTAEVIKVEKEIVNENKLPLPKPVYFRFDTDDLTYEDLHQIVLAIEHIRLGKNIIIEGHTDSHGAQHYNMALSLKRANKIKDMMIELGGVSADAISIKYFGEEKPAVANDNDQNRQLNRRVEFVVL